MKNLLNDAGFVDLPSSSTDVKSVPRESIRVDLGDGTVLTPDQIAGSNPLSFPLRKSLLVRVGIPELELGKHKVGIAFKSKPFGALQFEVEDAISEEAEHLIRIPRDANDDYNEAIIHQRQKFVEEFTGAKLNHITKYSFDPHDAKGNCDHFTGVMQVPLGIAGPITIHGEHAPGDFMIPVTTSEGTQVASYNRGIT